MHKRESTLGSHAAYRVAAGVLLCLSWLLVPVAQAANSDDPPDRVARLSYLKGEVSLKPAGTDEWAPSELNRPLTTDDQLSLDPNARAELQAGSLVIQLDGGAAFSFSELSDNVLQARVTDGAIHLTVRRLQKDEVVEIDTPQAAVTITKPGDYRIEVVDSEHTLVKTYSGECQVAGNSDSIQLQPRQQIVLDDSGDAVDDQKEFSPPDDFDQWAQTRNEQLNRSASSRYVAPDVIGYEDLDSHGEWSSAPEYGHVWYPRVVVGWSPYRYGHWAWVSPWGWTWVDNAPWGFAPFHYGRWAYIDARWGWVPGPIHVQPVYAPALVAWVGGPSFGVSVSFGANVGWFPLGPREVYVPGYHCGPRYIHNVNYSNTVIVNNTVINRAYVNRSTHIDYQHHSRHNAVTVVSRDTFVSARPVNNHMVHNRDMRGWHARGASPAITPERSSTLGPRWNANQSHAPDLDRRANREVRTRHAPPPQRASFDQEQRAVRENNNRPIPRGDLWANASNTHREPRNISGHNSGRSFDSGSHDGGRTGRNAGDHGNVGQANSGPGNVAGMHQRGNSQFRDDHPRRVFDRAQEERRPNTQSPLPSATPRENHESRPDNRQQRESQHGQQQSPRERTVFHSNDRLPNRQSGRQPDQQYGRMAGAQPEVRPERSRPENSAPGANWPRSNSPRYDSRAIERSRAPEQSRHAEAPQPQRYEQRESRPQHQPQPERQQRQPEQRQHMQNPAAAERREQPHRGRENNGRER